MKRILLAIIVAILCIGILPVAAMADGCGGGYSETWMVLSPQCTETTTITTTYGWYELTTVEYQPGCAPAPCVPDPCAPPPCQPEPDPCCKKKAIDNACKRIGQFSLDALKQLDRELKCTGWVRMKTSKRVLLKTGRCIYTVTVKNDETDEKRCCFMVARTSAPQVASECGRCQKKHKCSEYSLMFVTNYNTGCNAAVYEDEWLLTDYGVSDGEAICQFVDLLENGEAW